MAEQVFTIKDALTVCGVLNDTNNMVFNGANAARRISSEVFSDSFSTCHDLTLTDLEDSWKTYSGLTINQGQIRLKPGTKVNIKALIQCVRDQIRLDRNPADVEFPVEDRIDLINRFNTHKQWMDDAAGMAKTTMPKPFTDKMKWEDWKVTFINFLKTQHGRNGIPLNYIVRENVNTINRLNPNFLDDYVDQCPLQGRPFSIDAAKVHSYILRLISDNPVAEQKLLPHKDANNGRIDFMALKAFYEGVGANAKATLKAETDLQELFYAGEKKPHMWWDEFEVRLTNAFALVNKDAGRQVHTDEMKLQMLNKKVKADFLSAMKTNIEMQMNIIPMTMTFASAMANYRNTVNQRHPDNANTSNRRNRRIQNANRYTGGRGSRGGSGGRGGRGQGRGNGGKGGKGGNNNKRARNDEWEVTGLDGQRVKVHPSYRLSEEVWFNLPEGTRNQLVQMRQEYRANKQRQAPHHSSQVSQVSQGSAYPHNYQHYQQPVHYIGQASQYQSPVPGTFTSSTG